MSAPVVNTPAEVAQKAAELEPKLKGKLFLGGDAPSAADVEAFEALLGAHNTGLYRWVKHMASFTEQERAAWGEPTEPLAVAKPEKAEPKAAASSSKKEEGKGKKDKAPQSAVTFHVVPSSADVDLEALAKKVRTNKRDGLAWRTHKVAEADGAKKLVFHLTVADEKVTAEDIENVVMQYAPDVKSTEVAQW
eukprot:CAMPEP_0174849660 /NCGR_PEP_ID=MMETSP1114-20130205/16694_1 /TAXON_ID=312471 /ORGANISM="Neobodo designis, Strain CCAP 1951/1" /LENGTH=191 /DNA_ID=CAMNT_0016084041 /DNA_START=39 /DNA_END=611 /DNA_ORIENTATION=+